MRPLLLLSLGQVGLSEDNLKLGIWSGEVVLENLQLNVSSIERLGLPVRVVHGEVCGGVAR